MQTVRSGKPIAVEGGEREADAGKRDTPRLRPVRRPAHPDRYTRQLEQRLASIADAIVAVRDGQRDVMPAHEDVSDADTRAWSALQSVAAHCRELERRIGWSEPPPTPAVAPSAWPVDDETAPRTEDRLSGSSGSRSAPAVVTVGAMDGEFSELEPLSHGVGVVELDGRWVQVNRRLCEMFRIGAVELSTRRLSDLLDATHAEEIESIWPQLRSGARSRYCAEAEVRARAPEPKWVKLELSLRRTQDGAPQRLVCVVEDVTERHRTEARERALVAVSELLLSSLEWRNTLPGVARAVVPALGQFCIIEVERSPGAEPHAFIAHTDAARTPLLAQFCERWRSVRNHRQNARSWGGARDAWGPTVGIANPMPGATKSLLATRSSDTDLGEWPALLDASVPCVIFDVQGKLGATYGFDAEITLLAGALGLCTLASVPLRVADAKLGFLMLGFTVHRSYGDADLRFAQDLAHRVTLGLENARLYDEARAADHAREEFLSVASHEMRTPLTPLQLQFGRLLKLKADRGEVDPARLWGILQACERHVTRLVKLLDNLLDVSQATRGQLDISPSRVDLAAIVRDVADRFAPDLERAGIALSVDVSQPVIGEWDPLRIGQVVANLLSNAIKYGRGKPIRMTVSCRMGRARLLVEDQGIGISVDRIERVFDRFERAVSSSAYPGLGLGLFMVKEIVHAHGGAVEVHSVFGSGSTFIVELPVDRGGGERPRQDSHIEATTQR